MRIVRGSEPGQRRGSSAAGTTTIRTMYELRRRSAVLTRAAMPDLQIRLTRTLYSDPAVELIYNAICAKFWMFAPLLGQYGICDGGLLMWPCA